MLAPNVEQIEGAADNLRYTGEGRPYPILTHSIRDAQLKELQSFGSARAQALGASGLSTDLQAGYMLGLQTARLILAGSVALAKAGVNPEDVL